MPFVSIITLWIIGCIVVYGIGDHDKPICYDWTSTHLSQVRILLQCQLNKLKFIRKGRGAEIGLFVAVPCGLAAAEAERRIYINMYYNNM